MNSYGNLPNDWGDYFETCDAGHRYHVTEGCDACEEAKCKECDGEGSYVCNSCTEDNPDEECEDCDDGLIECNVCDGHGTI